MKTRFFIALLLIILLTSACVDKAANIAVGTIQINSPWAKAANNDENTAAFMVIKNTGSLPDRLVKVEFNSTNMVTLMNTVEKDGKMAMGNVVLSKSLPTGRLSSNRAASMLCSWLLPAIYKPAVKSTSHWPLKRAVRLPSSFRLNPIKPPH
jgi:hypothetical protein